ncbi:DUF92 domain-containing protein [Halalkalibaculum roseum]|uniref:DUF92 domain-containing protein n=1 Tax=Halalkalibaculum roseum TaxID=2709311 RepID=UPI002011EB62|nr:DUF92 domain-containing protein [Halalkalibaculum roseum]
MLSLISVFVLEANAGEHIRIITGAILAVIFCAAAFLFRWLSLSGTYAAIISGTIVFGLGGISSTAILLAFFISSTLISKKYTRSLDETSHAYSEKIRRDGLQVWSNGFWFTLFLLLWFVFHNDAMLLGALGAIATATADTWATELGSRRFSSQTYLISGFSKVAPGTDGGISVPGTLAAMIGSLSISLISIYVFSLMGVLIIPILVAGFLGCLADSYFGAIFQQKEPAKNWPGILKGLNMKLDNNMINWISSGFGALIAIILKLILI